MATRNGHRLMEARIQLERCDDEINRRSLARPGAVPLVPSIEDEAAEQERRRQHRKSLASAGVLTPARSGHGHSRMPSSSRGTPRANPPILTANELKDHYKTCITLSSNNKISNHNAFSLQLIDYMSHLLKAEEGNKAINFKLATTALDAGTKIYVARVDAVHSDAQRVADGIVQALDNKGRKGGNTQENGDLAIDENGEEIDPNNPDQDMNDENEGPRVKKTRRKKKGRTIAIPDSITVSKVESNVEIDPIFHKLTTSYDMANVNSLLLGNLHANDQNRLILDSNALLDKFRDAVRQLNGSIEDPEVTVHGQGDSLSQKDKTTRVTDASEIEPILKDVLEKQYKLFDDPYFRAFNFTNREGSLDDMSYRRDADDSVTTNQRPSTFAFDLNADLEPDTEPITTDAFNLDDGDFAANTGIDHHSDSEDDEETIQIDENGIEIRKPDPIAHQSMMQAFNLENFDELKNLLSDKPGEYSYFSDRIKNSWAGPGYWKLNPFHRSKAARLGQLAGQPASRFDAVTGTAKKAKKQFETLDFKMNLVLESIADRSRGRKGQAINRDQNTVHVPSNNANDIKLRVNTLQKWQQTAEKLLLPERIVYETTQLFNCGLREKVFSCVKYSGQNRYGSSQQSSQSGSVVLEGPSNDGRIADVLNEDEELECPDDEGFPTERPFSTTAEPMASQSSTQNPTMTLYGLELIEEPHAIQTIQLPFSKFAKRIDVKKLKRVMIDMIKNPETINLNKSLTGENVAAADADGVPFSQVYQHLPGLIPTQMGKDMSPPIAFVTLLHLANENNLVLQNLSSDDQMADDDAKSKLLAMKDIVIQLESVDMEGEAD